MDAITLDGDLCSRKGALTGGFIDVEKSRLWAHHTFKRSEETLCTLEGALLQKKQDSTAVDQQVPTFIPPLVFRLFWWPVCLCCM